MTTDTAAVPRASRWPAYVTLWRWHFYAGLFCIPFVLWLSLTGSLYLFRPQVEAWLDRPYATVATGQGPRATAAQQARAAVAAVPGSTLHRYQIPETPTQAAQVLVGRDGADIRVWVNPESLRILKVQAELDRPMRIVSRLHGNLMVGDPGSYLVELAASWTIVMILTGLALWWPRAGGWGGVVYPRLTSGGRRFWRDLHGVTGFWVSAMALFLLVSGLPWAKSWGSYLQAVRTIAEGPVTPDWTVGGAAPKAATAAMAGQHAEHGGMTMHHVGGDDAALDRVVAGLRPLELASPVLVAPPTGAGEPWTAKSDAKDRPLRTDLTLAADGRLLTRRDFAQRRLIDRLVGWGVAIHEGQAFGIANLLVNLAAALGLMLLAISSVVLWWRRKPSGSLGAPRAGRARAAGIAVAVPIVFLGILLPLFGASLLVVLAVDRWMVPLWPRFATWMGRPAIASPPAAT